MTARRCPTCERVPEKNGAPKDYFPGKTVSCRTCHEAGRGTVVMTEFAVVPVSAPCPHCGATAGTRIIGRGARHCNACGRTVEEAPRCYGETEYEMGTILTGKTAHMHGGLLHGGRGF